MVAKLIEGKNAAFFARGLSMEYKGIKYQVTFSTHRDQWAWLLKTPKYK